MLHSYVTDMAACVTPTIQIPSFLYRSDYMFFLNHLYAQKKIEYKIPWLVKKGINEKIMTEDINIW